MEFVPSILFSSLAGALLFFAGGRLSRAGAPKGPRAESASLPPPPSPQLDEERAQRSRAEEEAKGAWAAHEHASRSLADQRMRAAALLEQLQEERAAHKAAEAEGATALGTLRQTLERLQAEHAKAEQARAAAEQAHAAAVASERALRETMVRSVTATNQLKTRASTADTRAQDAERKVAQAERDQTKLTREVEDARVEIADLRLRLSTALATVEQRDQDLGAARVDVDQARRTIAALRAEIDAQRAVIDAVEREKPFLPDRAELQRRSVELALKARVIEQRTLEFERKDAENTELRAKVETLTGLARDNETLRHRVRDLEAHAFAHSLHEEGWPAPVTERPSGLVALENDLTLGLSSVLAAETGGHAAVLSDMRGLLIAAAGEPTHANELAAAASFTTFAAERLRELLPVGEPTALQVTDSNGLVLTTRWIRWEGECFLLSVLCRRPEAPPKAVDAFRTQLVGLIG